jgi:hypothetical protein
MFYLCNNLLFPRTAINRSPVANRGPWLYDFRHSLMKLCWLRHELGLYSERIFVPSVREMYNPMERKLMRDESKREKQQARRGLSLCLVFHRD